MGLFDDPSSLLPGLLPAAFRGVPFWVVDARSNAGRRLVQTYFPGTDIKVHQDLGVSDGPVRVRGFVIGDDYIAQAQALLAAFRAPGSATFLHPWLGEMDVVLSRPAEVAFDVKELRVARVEAEFEPTMFNAGSIISTLAGLLGALTGLAGAASAFVGVVMSASHLATASWAAGRDAAISAADSVAGAASRSSAASVTAIAMEQARDAIATIEAGRTRAEASVALGDAIAALPQPIGLAYRLQPVAAIGPSSEAIVAPSVADPRVGASVLLQAVASIVTLPRFGATDAATLIAVEAALLAEAGRTAADIPFESRQEALRWRGRIDGALSGLSDRVAIAAQSSPAPAATLWRAIGAARAALAVDINEVIGRLPSVRLLTPPRTVSAFLIAQDLVGDDPRLVTPMVEDIARRNRLRHAGAVRPTPIEILT